MTITTDHSASSYGIPVILDAVGRPMDCAPGVRAAREQLGLTQEGFAAALQASLGVTADDAGDGHTGVSVWAVRKWEQGHRLPGARALYAMADLLRRAKVAD